MKRRHTQLDRGLLPGLLGYRLRRAQTAAFQHFADTVTVTGITPGRFGLLVLIERNPGVSQTALARSLGVDRSTMVSMIDTLEGHGWVARTPAPGDRRSHALLLTAAGRAALREAEAQVRAHEAALLAGFSDAERDTLVRLLGRIAGDDP